ncbi:MAG TPA: HAD-IA family hydrolase [Acetobacteraceae bacterium]|nr:HAD-IA family hydrolase [Acetobacteraceae bacterium]
MARTILFDLDGTLVDSLPDLAASLNRVLASEGITPFAMEDVSGMVGDGLAALLASALAARGRHISRALLAGFRKDYFDAVAVASRPYPGVPETLATLAEAGWRMAVCTNKPEDAARRLLAALELAPYFGAVAGADSFPARKPDPGPLLGALATVGGEPARAIMLGDHANDIVAARAAGVIPVFALWGYGGAEMAGGALTLPSISALPPLAEDLLPPAPARDPQAEAVGDADRR